MPYVRHPSPITDVLADNLGEEGGVTDTLKVFAVLTVGVFAGVGIGYLLAVLGTRALARSLRNR